MKAILVIGLIGLAVWFGWKFSEQQTRGVAKQQEAPPPPITGTQLAGMAPSLEGTLEASQRRGAVGLRDFLTRYRNTIRDPRLAWIELDYVVLVASQDPAEAKRVFTNVKNRTPPSSQVYDRIKQLEKTYE